MDDNAKTEAQAAGAANESDAGRTRAVQPAVLSKPLCEGRIYRSNGWLGRYVQCQRKGTIKRDGKLYCKTHDPVSRKEREENRDRERNKRWASDREDFRFGKAAREFCYGVDAETLEAFAANGETLKKWMEEKGK